MGGIPYRPHRVDAYVDLANLCADMGSTQDYERFLRKAMDEADRFDSSDAALDSSSHSRIVASMVKLGEIARAEAWVDHITDTQCAAYPRLRLAQLLVGRGDLANAWRLAKKAIRNNGLVDQRAEVFRQVAASMAKGGRTEPLRATLSRESDPVAWMFGYLGAAEGIIEKNKQKTEAIKK